MVLNNVGRHDAFAMACASKYNDDIGYPGHTNCSDNFNTNLDAHGVLISDAPRSRPGDYVLMRALTDIVSVNSACPDDTSSANGWHLSDICVRTHSSAEKFSRSIARRPTPESEPKMTQGSGFPRVDHGKDQQHAGIQRLFAGQYLFVQWRD